MVRTITKKEKVYNFMIKIMRDYYNYQLDIYLTRYNDDVRHVPNIITIDRIDKLLDGKHPDQMGDIKHRFKLGMFLARPKKDPLTKAFLHGSLMDKAYDFDIPEDISEIPDHERVKPKPAEVGASNLKQTHRLLAKRAREHT